MSGRDPLLNKRPEDLRGPFVDFFAGSTKPPGGIPSRSVQGGFTPVVPPPTIPAVSVPATTLPAPSVGVRPPQVGGFDATPTAVPGITRITDASQPSAAPLFTNITDTGAAVRGFYEQPGISQASLDKTLATSPLFTRQVASADGTSTIDPLSAARAQNLFAADQAAAEAAQAQTRAQTAIAKGVTNSLRSGVPTAVFPQIVQGFANLQEVNAASTAGPSLGDQAAAANAETNAGNLAVNQARLRQEQTNAGATAERQRVNDIARISVNPETGLFDQTLFKQNLIEFSPVYGLGGDPGAAPSAGSVDALTDNAMLAKGYSAAQIQQLRAARAGR